MLCHATLRVRADGGSGAGLGSRQKEVVGRSSMVWHSMMERLATSLSCYAMPGYACAQMVVVVRGWVVMMSRMVSHTRRLVEEKAPPRLNNKNNQNHKKPKKTPKKTKP